MVDTRLILRFDENSRAAASQVAAQYFEALKREVAPFSTTIEKTLTISPEPKKQPDGAYRVVISSPYFWAGILDLGRGRVTAQRSTVLIWFRDPSKDPRIAAGYPRTKEQARARRLTKVEYERGLEMNRIARANGQPPYMIVREVSGKYEGAAFTIKALTALSLEARRQAVRPVRKYIEDIFNDALGSKRRFRI